MTSLSLKLALRYLRSRKRSRFVSFISFASLAGIALGVAVLITVLSVMNGFDAQIKHRFFSVAPQITIMNDGANSQETQALLAALKANQHVTHFASFVSGKVLLANGQEVSGAAILGVKPQQQAEISAIPSKMVAGSFGSIKPHSFNIILGQDLALKLGVMVGSKLTVMTTHATPSLFGLLPVYKQFTVTGIYDVGIGFGIDSNFGFISQQDAKALFADNAQSGWHVNLHQVFAANAVAATLRNHVSNKFFITDWSNTYGAFFNALAMEKNMMFLILILIVAVAAFNLVSGLVMMVQDKAADIAILRTMGASRGLIMRTFILQGAMTGLIGVLTGILLGIVLALNATSIVNFLQHVFHVQFISAQVYFVDYLPSKLEWSDVLSIALLAWGLCWLATIYPAWRAYRIKPAEALRYE